MLDGEIMESLPDVELMWHERIERKYFQQGVILGKQELIVYYLKQKFGGLPDGIVGKVEAVSQFTIVIALRSRNPQNNSKATGKGCLFCCPLLALNEVTYANHPYLPQP